MFRRWRRLLVLRAWLERRSRRRAEIERDKQILAAAEAKAWNWRLLASVRALERDHEAVTERMARLQQELDRARMDLVRAKGAPDRLPRDL